MQIADFRKAQAVVTEVMKNRKTNNGLVGVEVLIDDLANMSIKFFTMREPPCDEEYQVMSNATLQCLSPTDLRWLADTVEHFEEWKAGNKDYPLPAPF